ncbi:MAG: septum formation initiator family protein [Thermoanaerobacteraceae bacterium]|nr:septum formation initiator family protein [Thermoanaerobacteraceae bacterium]
MSIKRKIKIRHILFLCFLIYVISTVILQQFKISDLTRQETELEVQKKAAIEQREELKKEISLLHTDGYIERIARDELGLVKPGEYIIKSAKSYNKEATNSP